jgi:hypothetical protein
MLPTLNDKGVSIWMPKFDPEEKFDFKFVPIGIEAPNIVETPNPNLPTGGE